MVGLVLQYRGDLESHVVDAATTSEAVGFITLMQELKRKMRSWEQQVTCRGRDKLAGRQGGREGGRGREKERGLCLGVLLVL